MTEPNDINKDDILLENAVLIHSVVTDCNEEGSAPNLSQILQQAENNDWGKLVAAIRCIMSGNRDITIFNELDEEDKIIVKSVLDGIEDPASLPVVQADLHSDLAGKGIANLIHAAIQGSAHSRILIANTAEQMHFAGGDFTIMAVRLREIIEGERDAGKLSIDMSDQGTKLLSEILTELTKLEAQ